MKMTRVEVGFWVSSWLSYLELVGVLKRTVELGPARGELKSNSSGGWLCHGSAVAHEDKYGQRGRKLGWSCLCLNRHRLGQLKTS